MDLLTFNAEDARKMQDSYASGESRSALEQIHKAAAEGEGYTRFADDAFDMSTCRMLERRGFTVTRVEDVMGRWYWQVLWSA